MKIFKPSTLVSLGIAIAAALVTQPVRANSIVLTENSSTSLTATYNGVDITATAVVNTFPNRWTVTFPSTVTFALAATDWGEPGSSTFINVVMFGVAGGLGSNHQLGVLSDFNHPPVTNQDESTIIVGTDSSNGGSISMTFDDDGDVATVPDTGSTLGLLSLSVVALLGATRLRFLQLAA